MVSFSDRAAAGRHACDSDFSCPPPEIRLEEDSSLPLTSLSLDLNCVGPDLQGCETSVTIDQNKSHITLSYTILSFILKSMNDIQKKASRKALLFGLTMPPLLLQTAVPTQDWSHLEPVPAD